MAKGEQQKLIDLIQKKLQKGESVAQMADELEETEAVIEELIRSI